MSLIEKSYRENVYSRLTSIKQKINFFNNSENTTTKELYSYWRSEQVQSLKKEFDEMGVEPPAFKKLVGLTGRISDLAFSGYDSMTFKDLD